MYPSFNNNPYNYQPPNPYRDQNLNRNPQTVNYPPQVRQNYNNNNQQGGIQYQNAGGIYSNNYNNPSSGNQYQGNGNIYGNNSFNYNNQQGGNQYQGNVNIYGNNNYNNQPQPQPQQYPYGQNNAPYQGNTNNTGEVGFGVSSNIYGSQDNQPKPSNNYGNNYPSGPSNMYGSNNTKQNPPPIYQVPQQKNVPGYSQPQNNPNNQYPPNGPINNNQQNQYGQNYQNQQKYNNKGQNPPPNNLNYPVQQKPSQPNYNNIQQQVNNNIYNFNNNNNQPIFQNNTNQQPKPKIENAFNHSQQNINVQQNNPQMPLGNNFNNINQNQGFNSYPGYPQALSNQNQPKNNNNNNFLQNQNINQNQNIPNNNIQNKQGSNINQINNQFSGMNNNVQNNNNNYNNFNNNNNYNNNNIINQNNQNILNNNNNNINMNNNNNIKNNNNFFFSNNNININPNQDPSKLSNNNNAFNNQNKQKIDLNNQNNLNDLNNKINSIFDSNTLVQTQISPSDNSKKENQNDNKIPKQNSSPYPNYIEFINSEKQKKENNSIEGKPGNKQNIINLFTLPETSTVKQDSIPKPNIFPINNNNQNEWRNVNLDPLSEACVVVTKIEDKKSNNNKENEPIDDEEFKASNSVNPFYTENPFENNLEGSNNQWRVQDNNNIKPKENEAKEPIQNINLQNNLNISSIPETNTIISGKPDMPNNINPNNLNTEQNRKEWGNINLDPIASANIVATKIENKNQDKENKEGMDEESKAASTLNPFSSNITNPYINNFGESNNFDNNLNNVKSSEKQIDQPKEINFENIPDPLKDVMESNTIISENKPGDINNIDTKNDENINDFGNVDMDPFGKAKIAETVLEEKKENIQEKNNNDDDEDDDFKTASIVQQYSSGNEIQFETKVMVNNNLDNTQNKKDEQPDKDINNLANNLNFSTIPETNTIISERHDETNNINPNNLNTEQNRKEWGNIKLDPFADAEVVATTVENKKQDKENKEGMDEESKADSIINPFSSASSNPFINNLEGSNNLDNNLNNIKSSENKADQPKEINFENIPDPLKDVMETNTIISVNKPGEANNIEENNDNIKKEWGNIDMDPFGKANLAATVLEEKKEDIKNTNNVEDDDDDFNTASVVYQFNSGNDNQFEDKNKENNNLENSQNKGNNNISQKGEQPNNDNNNFVNNSIKTEPKKEETENIKEKKEDNFEETEIEDKKDMENNLKKISIPNPFYYDNPDNVENKDKENNNLQNDINNNSNKNENQINQSQNNANNNLNLLSNIISGNENEDEDEDLPNYLSDQIDDGNNEANNFSANMPNNQIQENNNKNENQNQENITVPSLTQIITGELEMKK